MDIKLIVVKGASKPGEVEVNLPTVIGRSNDVDLPLRHALISRQHCELSELDGVVIVRDLGSLNGTFVDDERITEAELRPGNLLTVGSVTFRVDYQCNDNGVSESGVEGKEAEVEYEEDYDEADTEEYEDDGKVGDDEVQDDALNNFFNNLS